MKIAVVSMIRDNWGGSEELWYAMAKEAVRQGHTLVHLSYNIKPVHPKLQELKGQGVIAYTRPGYKPTTHGFLLNQIQKGVTFFKKRLNRSFHKIFRLKPDIVIYNGTCYSIANETILCRYIRETKPGFYIIGHLNAENGPGITEAEAQTVKEMYGMSRKVFFVSDRSLLTARRQLNAGIQNGRIIRNPVNMKQTGVVEYPGRNGTVHFALVGNLVSRHKGQDIAVSILGSIGWKERDFHLNIYGRGPDEFKLREQVISGGLEAKVSFHGSVQDIRELWEKNHLLLMPSHMEGMPLALVEAMLCGRPSVVTDVGGMTEWVEEGKSGFVAGTATITAFSKAMEKAWQHKDQWKTMGLQAHERALGLYDPEPGKTLLREILN